MKDKILELRRNGKSMKSIAKELKCARSTVSYHCNNAGLGGKYDRKILTHDEINNIKKLYSDGYTNDKLSKDFNVSKYEIKKYTKKLKRYSRFDESLTRKQKTAIMVSERRRKLKDMAIDYKGGKCEKCGIKDWNGEELPFELDHIDGNKYNNELPNLQILCPNCHAIKTRHQEKGK